MAKYRISYMSYPDCPAATEHSREQAESGFYMCGFAGFATLGILFWYILALVALFTELNYINFIEAFGALIGWRCSICIFTYYVM
jgi:hypothetical protein